MMTKRSFLHQSSFKKPLYIVRNVNNDKERNITNRLTLKTYLF